MRTGSEPTTARSVLRARLWLSVWGLVWAIAGTVAFVLAGRPGWAIACGVLWLIVTVDLAMVLRHIRQGPHYQPGPDIPPYRPPEHRALGRALRRPGSHEPMASCRKSSRASELVPRHRSRPPPQESNRAAARYSGCGSSAAASLKWRRAWSERPERS